ncbi:MAG TPA: hypothetical protein VNJ08_01355 [Bacteriovoracaceae bacterium]|nr:hypothetical protein [Bacteriovoracaceae bacterium]
MKTLFGLFLGAMAFSALAAPLEIDRPWQGISDPLIFGRTYNRSFTRLPLNGQIKNKNRLWSGDYWPLNKGNINYRWFAREKIGFNLKSPGKTQSSTATQAQLSALSPSEKYDIFTGRYDYPLKAWVDSISSPNALKWEGICHGWAAASINHNEPVPVIVTNPDGIKIPFGTTDIKALLSYYYAYGFQSTSIQMGQRCYPESGDGCQEDMNAGAFHIVLANRLGIEGLSFIADIESTGEVWNNPAYQYTSYVVKELRPYADSARGTVKVVRVRTDFYFADNGDNSWRPVIGTYLQVIKKHQYEYDLDLDASGNIIGGTWLSKLRPDFLWLKGRPSKFNGILSRLGELTND